ncbi:hypothetical protein EWM64_g6164 [Hericium alpestre]|uniref:Uncharacterized protein n=1 Tax=Hericium alpestre TaxID=135208 RepID=A0A4Y9ZSS4_9AGAM|nr:hypothetical protein EWM64_g6164 [Hericium alpestre]
MIPPANGIAMEMPATDAATARSRQAHSTLPRFTPPLPSPTLSLPPGHPPMPASETRGLNALKASPMPSPALQALRDDISRVDLRDLDASSWPVLFSKALKFLLGLDFSDGWRLMLAAFFKHEEKHGFSPGGGRPWLNAKGRPAVIAEWIQWARAWCTYDIGDTDAMAQAFWTWWRALQPPAHLEKDSMALKPATSDLSWEKVDVAGQNGLLSVVAALAFWGMAIRGSEEVEDEKSWEDAVADVTSVLKVILLGPIASGCHRSGSASQLEAAGRPAKRQRCISERRCPETSARPSQFTGCLLLPALTTPVVNAPKAGDKFINTRGNLTRPLAVLSLTSTCVAAVPAVLRRVLNPARATRVLDCLRKHATPRACPQPPRARLRRPPTVHAQLPA